MFSLSTSPEQLIKKDTPKQLILAGFHKMKLWGLISLILAVVTAAATLSIGLNLISGAVVLMYLILGVWLMISNHTITFDSSHQAIYFSTHHRLLKRTTRIIPFAKITAIYLDYEELHYYGIRTIYTPKERIGRKWRIFLTLNNQETVTVARQYLDHPPDKGPILSKQTVEWENLAAKICTITDKLLVRTPSVPGPAPHTFIDIIDQIVQRRLVALPSTDPLSNRSVHLRSHPTGAMEIIVDGVDKYRELADVTEPAIRDLIQQAVDEWQNLGGHSIADALAMRISNE